MPRVWVYLIEAGFASGLPGFAPTYPSSLFPFWGDYYFFDFALANFRSLKPEGITVLTPPWQRGTLTQIATRWDGESIRFHVLEEGLPEIVHLLEECPAERVIIASSRPLYLMDSSALASLCAAREPETLKISIDHTPVELYLGERRLFLKSFRRHLKRAAGPGDICTLLFGEILADAFEVLHDVPGNVFFTNSLMSLYEGNLWLVANNGSQEHRRVLARLNGGKGVERETIVESTAVVRNSYLASGVRVAGQVENSILFSDCIVRKGARIVNSVVMNNNRIGARADIARAMLYPYQGDQAKGSCNIGEGASIGNLRSTARNDRYPDQIHDGLAVLGLNAEIPADIVIEPGCLVGPDVPVQELKKRKVLKKGSTVEWNSNR